MKPIVSLVLALILLLGAFAFGIVGYLQLRNTPEATEVTDYGMMPFYVYSFGYGTAYNADDDSGDSIEMRYVEYRNEDGRFSFLREVSAEEYADFEIARENGAEHRSVNRYVYTYLQNGEMKTIIQEQSLTDNQLREIVGNTARATVLQYFVFAGLLLLTGVYFLIAGIRKRAAA
ncbi:MAG: hypothetical protein IJP98_04165 [Clostridia bacterium]|nr:hypothetical protein [Clostridia bacterium]